jgi:hypothetical protein
MLEQVTEKKTQSRQAEQEDVWQKNKINSSSDGFTETITSVSLR